MNEIPKKLYTPGFNMLLGLAGFKDFLDVFLSTVIGIGLVSLPASTIGGFFAGVVAGVGTAVSTGSVETGVAVATLSTLWPFVLMAFQIFLNLMMSFIILLYFIYNQVGFINKKIGKYVARGSLAVMAKFIPITNLIPSTVWFLLWVRKVENNEVVRKHQKELGQIIDYMNKLEA